MPHDPSIPSPPPASGQQHARTRAAPSTHSHQPLCTKSCAAMGPPASLKSIHPSRFQLEAKPPPAPRAQHHSAAQHRHLLYRARYWAARGSNPSAPPSSTAAHPAKSPSPRPAVCHLQPASGASKGSQSAAQRRVTYGVEGGGSLARPEASSRAYPPTHPSSIHALGRSLSLAQRPTDCLGRFLLCST